MPYGLSRDFIFLGMAEQSITPMELATAHEMPALQAMDFIATALSFSRPREEQENKREKFLFFFFFGAFLYSDESKFRSKRLADTYPQMGLRKQPVRRRTADSETETARNQLISIRRDEQEQY
jgi:hypothetical protein